MVEWLLYTHHEGYKVKMILFVHDNADEDGERTHLSVYPYHSYDDELIDKIVELTQWQWKLFLTYDNLWWSYTRSLC